MHSKGSLLLEGLCMVSVFVLIVAQLPDVHLVLNPQRSSTVDHSAPRTIAPGYARPVAALQPSMSSEGLPPAFTWAHGDVDEIITWPSTRISFGVNLHHYRWLFGSLLLAPATLVFVVFIIDRYRGWSNMEGTTLRSSSGINSDGSYIRFSSTLASSSKHYNGPDPSTKPSYDDSDPVSVYLLGKFRENLAEQGYTSPKPGYDGLVDTITMINRSTKDAALPQRIAYTVEQSILPAWLPPAYRASFAKYMPKRWQAPMFAWITKGFFRWLVGDCEVVAGETDTGEMRPMHTVQIKRCRFLEESGCASVCVNSCKLPTQQWFLDDFGMDLRITPNYEDFSCKFEMDRKPLLPEEDPALVVPCLLQCPSKAPLRHASPPVQTSLDENCSRLPLL